MAGQQDQGWEPRPGVRPTPRGSTSHRRRLPSSKLRAYWGPGVLPTPSMASPPCDLEVLAPRDHCPTTPQGLLDI